MGFLINNFGETILHVCAYFSELEMMKYLLETRKFEIDVNIKDNGENTVVMSAIFGHHISIPEYKILKMVKYLATKQNAIVSISNFDGKTPLQKSFDFNLNYVAKFLWHCEQLQKIGELN